MCVSDWRLGTLVRSKTTNTLLAAGSVTIPADTNRVGLLINVSTSTDPSAFNMTYNGTPFLDPVVLTAGQSTAEYYFTLKDHGNFPQGRFVITKTLGTIVVAVAEMTLPTGVIAAGLDEFRRSYPGSY